ncbi:MAG: GNAT family N-acetyltransferase [Myxococcota bacterium]
MRAVRSATHPSANPAGSQHLAGLAPIGVFPAQQGKGVGSALMDEAIRRAQAMGWSAIFLLGDPAYYARFGFVLAAPLGLRYESEVFDPGFQVLELTPNALEDLRGYIEYDPAFSTLTEA